MLPLAFFMGMPFPLALRQLQTDDARIVPWAWGLNGFASVIAAAGAQLLAVEHGYTAVAFLGAAAYGGALLVRQPASSS